MSTMHCSSSSSAEEKPQKTKVHLTFFVFFFFWQHVNSRWLPSSYPPSAVALDAAPFRGVIKSCQPASPVVGCGPTSVSYLLELIAVSLLPSVGPPSPRPRINPDSLPRSRGRSTRTPWALALQKNKLSKKHSHFINTELALCTTLLPLHENHWPLFTLLCRYTRGSEEQKHLHCNPPPSPT